MAGGGEGRERGARVHANVWQQHAHTLQVSHNTHSASLLYTNSSLTDKIQKPSQRNAPITATTLNHYHPTEPLLPNCQLPPPPPNTSELHYHSATPADGGHCPTVNLAATKARDEHKQTIMSQHVTQQATIIRIFPPHIIISVVQVKIVRN